VYGTGAADNSVLVSHYNTRHGGETDFSIPSGRHPSPFVDRPGTVPCIPLSFSGKRRSGAPEKKFVPLSPLTLFAARSLRVTRRPGCTFLSRFSRPARNFSLGESWLPNKNLTNAIADAKKPLSRRLLCHVISLLLLPVLFPALRQRMEEGGGEIGSAAKDVLSEVRSRWRLARGSRGALNSVYIEWRFLREDKNAPFTLVGPLTLRLPRRNCKSANLQSRVRLRTLRIFESLDTRARTRLEGVKGR